MATNVFLSYATADKALGMRVAQSLGKNGITVLTNSAVSAESTPSSETPYGLGVTIPTLLELLDRGYGEQLRKGLQNSDAVVIVLSDASVNNAYVMTELGAAMGLNKRIVAIKPSLSPLEISLPATPSIETLSTEGMSADEIATTIRNHLAN